MTDHLLALIADQLAIANWQRQGKRNAPKPKPIERPGMQPQAQQFGSDPIPIADFDNWWSGELEVDDG